MRYLTIPATVKIKAVVGVPKPNEAPVFEDRDYPYHQFLDENVWTDATWRATRKASEAYDALTEKDWSVPGSIVEIADEDFEVFQPLATMKDKQLTPINHRPISKYTNAAMYAVKKNPRKEESKEDDAQPAKPASQPS
jgi:hypothetical protein